MSKRIIRSIRNCALEEEIVEGGGRERKLFSFHQRRIERERSVVAMVVDKG